jgi:predicted 3-demethylubiquinone-9 3-methyltransferase (glyoxalase superfamily)
MTAIKKISTCLWFNGQAEEAAEFYTGIFKHPKIGTVTRYGDVGPGPKGTVHDRDVRARRT